MSVDLKRVKERAKQADNIRYVRAGIERSEKMRKEYLDYKKAEKESAEFIRNQQIRKMLQSVALEEKQVVSSIISEIDSISASLKIMAVANLSTDNTTRSAKKASFEEVERFVNECLPILKLIQNLSKDSFIDEKTTSIYNIYERCFNELTDINNNFIYFAPLKCFKRSITMQRIETLPDNVKYEVYKKQDRLERNENADYVSENLVCELEPNITTKKVSNMVESLNNKTENAEKVMAEATARHSEELYNFIVRELSNKEEISWTDIANIVKFTSTNFKSIKKYASNDKVAQFNSCNEYERLFTNLIKFNNKFAFFAPKQSIIDANVNYVNLSEEEKTELFNRFKKYGLFEDKKFVKRYGEEFAKLLINDLEKGV